MKILQSLTRRRKLISINIIFLIIFLSTPSLILSAYSKFKNSSAKYELKRASYPAFNDPIVAKRIREEQSLVKSIYNPFTAFLPKSIKGNYVNIEGKYSSRKSYNDILEDSTWFFGGSTIFGLDSEDNHTIPSKFAKLTNSGVKNFGVVDWNSRQSLNHLISIIGDGNNPKRIVFYDGVNDVLHGCKEFAHSIPTHSMTKYISDSISKEWDVIYFLKNKYSQITQTLLKPYVLLTNKLLPKVNKETFYWNKKKGNCLNNLVRHEEIASHLVNNWYLSYQIAQSKGANFLAILQPTTFSSSSPLGYLMEKDRHRIHADEFNNVYKAIRRKIREVCIEDNDFCSSIKDGSKWLNVDFPVFTDFVHVSQKGNLIIAERIFEILN